METSFQLEESLVDPLHGQIVGPGGPVRLEPRVMRVVVCLAERSGEIVSRERLIEQVWEGSVVTDEVLTQSVSELRKALGEKPKEPRFIQTIPKQSYRLIAAVVPTGATEAGVQGIVQEPLEPKAPLRAVGGALESGRADRVGSRRRPLRVDGDSGRRIPSPSPRRKGGRSPGARATPGGCCRDLGDLPGWETARFHGGRRGRREYHLGS